MSNTQFTSLYKKLSTHTINTAYKMVKVRNALEKNPKLRWSNIRRCKETSSTQQNAKLLGNSAKLALTAAKKKLKELQREYAKNGKPK